MMMSIGRMKNAYKLLSENSKEKTTLETRSKWEDNIKLDHKETGCEDVAAGGSR
jgi:hypothetical protein